MVIRNRRIELAGTAGKKNGGCNWLKQVGLPAILGSERRRQMRGCDESGARYVLLVSNLYQRTVRLEGAIRKPVDGLGKGGGEDEPTTMKHIGMKSLIKW